MEGLTSHDDQRTRGGAGAVGDRRRPDRSYRLDAIGVDLSRLPKTVLILLENLLRRAGSRDVSDDDVRALAAWPGPAGDVAFMPGRVLMQDFTGVPAVVDLAAMRSAIAASGRRSRLDQPVDPGRPRDRPLRVQVDLFRSPEAYEAQHRVRVPAER